ncbi:Protein SRG1 [Vitis vinifera]|uniref:Protein SRG1 n=1 Tax=Vitis vinifera TaxID=29760 RepID=A0A438JPD0_VITVI|nr:Protein SRG1 [Vitis vinifera]
MSETTDFELENLHSTCREWGAFQTPLEEKMKYKIRPGSVEGYGLSLIRSQDQKLDWGDRFYMITNPFHRRNPHLLSELPPSLSEDDLLSSMPTTRAGDGLTPHSDASGITVLLQVNGVDGLQVKKDGVWIPVNFLPDAFVVNLGDILELEVRSSTITDCTNCEQWDLQQHRAQAVANSVTERISIAMFFNTKFSAEIGPAIGLINPQNPPLFKRVGMEKYFRDFFARKLEGKAYLEYMKIKNGEGDTA